MSDNRKEKPLSQTIRNYYPKAFVMHQDVTFRVDGPTQTGLPGITPDDDETSKIDRELMKNPELAEKVWERVLYELETRGFDTTDLRNQIDDDEEEDEDYVNVLKIIVPELITLRLDKGLNVGRCPKCGNLQWINKISRNSQNLPVHNNCPSNSRDPKYRQAPVFVPYPEKTEDKWKADRNTLKIQTIIPKDVNCYYLKPGNGCNHPQSTTKKCDPSFSKQHSYMQQGPNYPLSGIKIVNNHCPLGLKNIPSRGLTPVRAGTGLRYQKQFPANGITQRLYTSIAWETNKQSEEIDEINSAIQEIKKTWFNQELVNFEETKFARLRVIDVIYGIRIGGYYDSWAGDKKLLGRMLKTQGFVITLNEKIWDVAENLKEKWKSQEEDPVKEIVTILAHTLKHAILNNVPTFTGIDETKFGGSYEVLPDKKGVKIYYFDNEEGGHGGFATLTGDVKRFSDMMSAVYNQTECPVRNCNRGCKHCLFIRNCGLGNQKIHRKLLLAANILQKQLPQ
tara:strand:+ start:11648 stop:13171 length:1524 start_codon:yes stop_codon:yes gene_type:complete